MRTKPKKRNSETRKKNSSVANSTDSSSMQSARGKLGNILDGPEPQVLAAVQALDVQWLNADSVLSDRNLTMQLRVTEGGAAASGARLTFRFARPGAAPFYTQTVADSGGAAEIKIEVEEASLPDSSLLVQASFAGRTATRKFVLRRVE